MRGDDTNWTSNYTLIYFKLSYVFPKTLWLRKDEGCLTSQGFCDPRISLFVGARHISICFSLFLRGVASHPIHLPWVLLNCISRHPLALEKRLEFLLEWCIWSWSFSSTSVPEGEWISRHSWSRQWPVHTDFGELWQTCGNWTTFYKVLCTMVCRVKNKKYFSFAFLLSLFSFCISSVFFFFATLSFFFRCSHCRKLAPTWKALAEYHKDNMDITIAKVQ